MTSSIKAALLSGLVFPGLGHLALKHYLRGSILMLATLIALSVIIRTATSQALTIVGSITRGDMPADAGSIAEMVSASTSGPAGSGLNIATLVLGACWIFSIIDAYRLGMSPDNR